MSSRLSTLPATTSSFSLPNEIQEMITPHTDHWAKVNLMRIFAKTNQHFSTIIWRSVMLSVSNPFMRLLGPLGGRGFNLSTLAEEAERLRKEASMELGRKLDLMADLAQEETWGKVKEAHIVTSLGCAEQVHNFLRRVRETVEVIEFGGYECPALLDTGINIDNDNLEERLSSQPLRFPRLTSLTFQAWSLYNPDVCAFLCSDSPSLSTLKLNFVRHRVPEDDFPTPSFPRIRDFTSIKRFQVSWDDAAGLGRGDDFAILAEETCLELLQMSPAIDQLALKSGDMDKGGSEIARYVCHSSSLRDVSWNISPTGLSELADGLSAGQADGGLHRLVLKSDQGLDTFETLPHLPHLKELYFSLPSSSGPLPTCPMPQSLSSVGMLSGFAKHLRLNSHLRIIHALLTTTPFGDLGLFDRLDDIKNSAFSGRVSSMIHGYSELLCARLYQDMTEVVVDPNAPNPNSVYQTTKNTTLPNGQVVTKTFEQRSTSAWVIYTDFAGLTVPMDVIEEMKRVEESGSVVDWAQRGVEVGSAAWKVLLDWQE